MHPKKRGLPEVFFSPNTMGPRKLMDLIVPEIWSRNTQQLEICSACYIVLCSIDYIELQIKILFRCSYNIYLYVILCLVGCYENKTYYYEIPKVGITFASNRREPEVDSVARTGRVVRLEHRSMDKNDKMCFCCFLLKMVKQGMNNRGNRKNVRLKHRSSPDKLVYERV